MHVPDGLCSADLAMNKASCSISGDTAWAGYSSSLSMGKRTGRDGCGVSMRLLSSSEIVSGLRVEYWIEKTLYSFVYLDGSNSIQGRDVSSLDFEPWIAQTS